MSALKVARGAALWFHRSYNGAPAFKAGPFVPPVPPGDASAALEAELDRLRQAVRRSGDAEAKARLAAREADAARLDALSDAARKEDERRFWEAYAAETENGRRIAEAALADAQAAARAASPAQLDALAQVASAQASAIELDEATTRILIDEQLRRAGWTVDSAALRHATGARPQPGHAMAIAEWPTASGPVDYALFVDERCIGLIEAKREIKDVPGRLAKPSGMPAVSS